MSDAGVSTPVHFVESFIDPRYEWSEWALRRRALRIANLRQCATHGAQTDGSNFRRDNDTQTYLPREAETQTLSSVATNTQRTVTYVTGVRGVPEPLVELAAARRAQGLPLSSRTKIVERTAPVAKIVSNVIDECEDPSRFRYAVAVPRHDA